MDPRMNSDPPDKVLQIATRRAALTDRHLRALRPGPRAIEAWDSQQRGLIVRVLPSGRIEFAIRYRIHGKRRRLKLSASLSSQIHHRGRVKGLPTRDLGASSPLATSRRSSAPSTPFLAKVS